MTATTLRAIVCECGYSGHLVRSENDAPHSSLWEEYGLEGFAGGSLVVTSYADRPKDLLAALRPTCPKCGDTGKVKYARGT